MTTYYVRRNGNNGSAGTSAATAWLTIDYAASTVAAGDIIYIGAGFYAEKVTLDTSGSAGSVIKFIGDVTGEYTGDAGLIIINGSTDTGLRANSYALNLNGKLFTEFENILFDFAYSTISNDAPIVGATGNSNYEGVKFTNCVIASGTSRTNNVYIVMGAVTTPATEGLTFSKCLFESGALQILWTDGAAACDLKIVIDRCIFLPALSDTAIQITGSSAAGATASGGVKISNCLIMYAGNIALYAVYTRSTTYPVEVSNCIFYKCVKGMQCGASATANSMVSRGNNLFLYVTTAFPSGLVVAANGDIILPYSSGICYISGIHDIILKQLFGWSPFNQFEIFTTLGAESSAAKRANSAYLLSNTDFYGNPSVSGGTAVQYGYFDASDDAFSDPNNVWNGEANGFDSDPTLGTSCGTNGSDILNYLFAGGTTLHTEGIVSQVRARATYSTPSVVQTGNIRIYTDTLAEILGNVSLPNSPSISTTAWVTLSAPTGGWTAAALAALEIKAWRASGAGGSINIYIIELEATIVGTAADIGPVQTRHRPQRESGTVYDGTYSARFDGAGWHDFFVPVDAAYTVITAYARYDSGYTGGNLPVLEILDIPGVADQLVAMTAGADTWEQLSVNFTPSATGWVRVRLRSRDTGDGNTFFDLLAQT